MVTVTFREATGKGLTPEPTPSSGEKCGLILCIPVCSFLCVPRQVGAGFCVFVVKKSKKQKTSSCYNPLPHKQLPPSAQKNDLTRANPGLYSNQIAEIGFRIIFGFEKLR
jgi:hypothetical protein